MSNESEKLAHYYWKKGHDAEWEGNYEEAILYFSKAIEITPNDALLYSWRSNSYWRTKRYSEAISDITIKTEVLKSPRHQDYCIRARCKYAILDFEGAINDYSLAIELYKFESVPHSPYEAKL